MTRRIALFACALALVVTTGASADQQRISGTVTRVDPAAGIIEFRDGNMIKLSNDMVVLVDNRPVTLDTVRPGTYVVVQPGAAAAPVVVAPAPGSSVVTVPANPPTTAVVPPPTVTVTPPSSSSAVVVPSPPAPAGTTVLMPPVTRNADGTVVVNGTVASVASDGTITLTDGRMIRVAPNATIVANGQPVAVSTLQPGTVVMVQPSTADVDPSALVRAGTVIESSHILIQRGPEAR